MAIKETIDDIGERAGEVFETIGEAASNAFDTISAAASDTVEVQKRKSSINKNKRIIEADYAKVGKVIYDRFAEGEFADEELACLFNEISDAKVKIRDLQVEIDQIKSKKAEARKNAEAPKDGPEVVVDAEVVSEPTDATEKTSDETADEDNAE